MTLPFDAAVALQRLRSAAQDRRRVDGLTHQYYKYPARFSPEFVSAAIDLFSAPGDTVLDPYMGGGTTIVEALAAGRYAVGYDLNPLAVFVTEVKTTLLTDDEIIALRTWAVGTVPTLSYHSYLLDPDMIFCEERTRNLTIPRARAIKKFLALAIESIASLPSTQSQKFARCVLLSVGQWALNGRKLQASLSQFRAAVTTKTLQMLAGAEEYSSRAAGTLSYSRPILLCRSAEEARNLDLRGVKEVDLVVTSPPYPGVHVLYHRWQVDGRRETPAPYWIAGLCDGHGGSYYTFGDRQSTSHDDYFAVSLRTLRSIRQVMRDGALMVQMLAFSEPRTQLPRYLDNMRDAGFHELRSDPRRHQRIWRDVPGRAWHAQSKGRTDSAREVVLVHVAN